MDKDNILIVSLSSIIIIDITVQVVKILLTEYSADSETEGVVKFDGHVIEGATALWCANLLKSLLF